MMCAQLSPEAREIAGSAAGKSLLIIEDDPHLRRMLVFLFAREGWRVADTGDGFEALRLLEKGRPDAILLDVMMPAMDGFSFYEELLRLPRMRGIPVVVLTALSMGRHRERFLVLGAEDYVEKPFDVRDLVARMERAVAACPPP